MQRHAVATNQGVKVYCRSPAFWRASAAVNVADRCRKEGFSTATFYKRRAKFGGMEASDAKRLRELEAENA